MLLFGWWKNQQFLIGHLCTASLHKYVCTLLKLLVVFWCVLAMDAGRALFRFAIGKTLGDQGLKWLKIHLMNMHGLMKKWVVYLYKPSYINCSDSWYLDFSCVRYVIDLHLLHYCYFPDTLSYINIAESLFFKYCFLLQALLILADITFFLLMVIVCCYHYCMYVH